MYKPGFIRIRRFLNSTLLAAVAVAAAAALQAPAHAAGSAVVFMYHRFGEGAQLSTNIRLDQFEAHIEELTKGKLTVMGLPEIVAALRTGRPLPDRTVGLSIDDAFLSVYTQAWPRLRAAGLPFTLFVATDAIDGKLGGYMNWDQIRELAAAGVTIGSQTASHLHMPTAGSGRNAADLAKSNARLEKELGQRPRMIAYPYGEYSLAVGREVGKAGFGTAFGQHSGVLHTESNFLFLPRFAMNEAYGNIGRFRLAANALPLQVRDITPADPLLSAANNPPHFGFTVFGEAVRNLGALACYSSGQGKARLERLGRQRIEVRLEQPFPVGRARMNCTMPGGKGRWRWFGIQFYVPPA